MSIISPTTASRRRLRSLHPLDLTTISTNFQQMGMLVADDPLKNRSLVKCDFQMIPATQHLLDAPHEE